MNIIHGNWVDLIIILILIFFIHQGFINSFWSILIDFVAFFGALLISLKTYKVASAILKSNFSLNPELSNALGYLAMAIIAEILISFILSLLIKKLPPKILKNHITKIFGVILSFLQGLILIAFAVTFIISLPINPSVKTDVSNSKIGGFILTKTSGLEKNFPQLTYIPVEPESHESIPLDNKPTNLTIDEKTETQMFKLVNQERVNRGINALTWDVKLVVVGENYAKLMWQNDYFGHYDKEGNDIGYRLEQAKVSYTTAGENLALAPTVEIAHSGLMDSPGHKENILEASFKKVGIGVIDNGFYGKIFVQVFTD